MKKLFIVAALFAIIGLSASANSQEKKGPLYATLKTSMGDIVIQLFDDKAPKTVANFVGLASGTKEWTDTKTNDKVKKPLYNGTIFHRVIPGFMIQGGDPEGTGGGGPGYTIKDEPIVGQYDRGVVAMARTAAPNSQGSQFFIIVADSPHLGTGGYTIFGRVTSGMEVVDQIVAGPRTGPDDDLAADPEAMRRVTIDLP